MVDNVTTNLPNGQLFDIESFDPFRDLVKIILKQYKSEHNFAAMGPFYGVVFGLDSDGMWDRPTDDESRMRRITDSPMVEKVKIYAYIEGITLTPKPTSYAINSVSGSAEFEPGALDTVLMLPRFVAKEESMYVPSLGELVYVDWLNKPSNDISEWTDPVYLGPIHKTKPIILPLPTKETAKGAFDKENLPKGVIKAKSPIQSKYLGFEKGVGPTAEQLEISNLVNNIKEIYIDKEIDYPEMKNYDIIPGSPIIKDADANLSDYSLFQYRKNNKSFFLPPDLDIKQRKETRLFIIGETGFNYIQPYKKLYSNPTMHYTISMNSNFNGSVDNLASYKNGHKKRLCTIRVNIPFGLVVNEKNIFSRTSVGCMVSSPFDGASFFTSEEKWDSTKTTKEINESTRFSNFKNKLNTWIANKSLPDNSSPFILGPFGTPGLRTGPHANQNISVAEISNNNFWTGQITWSPTGHYFLPTLDQAEALYDLVSSLIDSPPKSAYSWGYKRPSFHKQILDWNFPAVGGGANVYPTSHFIQKGNYEYEYEPGFPWGLVGPTPIENKKPELYWENGLQSRGRSSVFGITSDSRWGTKGSPFLEHYLLARALGFGHLESWYVTIAAAAETTPKLHKGKGHGPTRIPVFGDISLNKSLEKGQRMWSKAMSYMEQK